MHGSTQAAIAEYNRDILNEAVTPESEAGGIQKLKGSGKVVMKRVLFLDEEQREITETQTGRPLTLRLEYECKVPEKVPTLVDLHIKDQSGIFSRSAHDRMRRTQGWRIHRRYV